MTAQPDRRQNISTYAVTRGLGWISVAMGLTLLAPARAACLFGLGPRPGLMCAIGARDLVIGLGLLRDRQPTFWLRVHAAADAVDATFVVSGLLRGTIARLQGWPWLMLALACGWISVVRAKQLDHGYFK